MRMRRRCRKLTLVSMPLARARICIFSICTDERLSFMTAQRRKPGLDPPVYDGPRFFVGRLQARECAGWLSRRRHQRRARGVAARERTHINSFLIEFPPGGPIMVGISSAATGGVRQLPRCLAVPTAPMVGAIVAAILHTGLARLAQQRMAGAQPDTAAGTPAK